MPSEIYKRLRHEPESWTVEVHTVDVFVGTDGYHQDEFMRGDRPKDLFRGSIATPSLVECMKQELLKLPVTQSDETPPGEQR